MYDLKYLGASKLLRYKCDVCYMQLRCKLKIYKEKYRMFARDSQTLRNKRHFVISMITLDMFYCSRSVWLSFYLSACLSIHL